MDREPALALADGAACLDYALQYLTLGWSVLPLCPPDHIGVGRVSREHSRECGSPGKRPWIAWKKYQDELPTPADVRHWWGQLPNGNLGCALGPVSGIVRIDVEGAAGEEALRAASGGDLPPTAEFRSGRADGTGRGLIYRAPAGVALRTTYDKFGPCAELRYQARGAQTVLPPSRHPDGGLYTWSGGLSPFDVAVAPAPAWLVAALLPGGGDRPHRDRADWAEIIGGVPEGSRDDSITRLIGKLLYTQTDLNDSEALFAVYRCVEAVNERNDPPLSDADLKKCFTSILRSEREQRSERERNAWIDRVTRREVREAAAPANGSGPHPESPGEESQPQGPPEWHLVVVGSEPVEYRLRSPHWSAAPPLAGQGGYLTLTAKQLLSWSEVKAACVSQAHLLPEEDIRNWARADGPLPPLFAAATRLGAVPESRRGCAILSFVLNYLRPALPLREDAPGEPPPPRSGAPLRQPSGSVIFKFAHLKRKIREAREDYSQGEVSKLLTANGFTQEILFNSRWWKATAETLSRLSGLTLEADT